MSTFSIDCVIADSRARHYRERDHHGFEHDTAIWISQPIGPYPTGSLLSDVLAALEARLLDVELNQFHDRSFHTFSMDAYIAPGAFWADAVIFKTLSGSSTMNAWLARGGSLPTCFVSPQILMLSGPAPCSLPTSPRRWQSPTGPAAPTTQ